MVDGVLPYGEAPATCGEGAQYDGDMDDTDMPPITRRNGRAVPAAASSPVPAAEPRGSLRYEALRFPGCRRISLTRDQFERSDDRIEYWDARMETAWVVADEFAVHEGTSRRLPHLAERIASLRGAPIVSFGSVTLLVRDAEGRPRRAMEADETLYLHPARSATPIRSLAIGEHDYPDVVLEVDHTTDVRPGKLLLYEAWGFPELWVIVPPEGASPRRPAGVTIHRLQAGRYRSAPASGAFPGWTAAEIFGALTEPTPSAATCRVLERVGRALGAAGGTGPADDPLSRVLLAEGRLEGRAAELAAAVRSLLQVRGITLSPASPGQASRLADASRDTVMAAAYACADEADFWRRLGMPQR